MSHLQVRIDKNLLDQSKFFAGKNGASYINLVLFENKNGPDQWGNTHIVKQDSTQEERENNIETPILGNAKPLGGGSNSGGQQRGGFRGGSNGQSRGGYAGGQQRGGSNSGGQARQGGWNNGGNQNQGRAQNNSRQFEDDSSW